MCRLDKISKDVDPCLLVHTTSFLSQSSSQKKQIRNKEAKLVIDKGLRDIYPPWMSWFSLRIEL